VPVYVNGVGPFHNPAETYEFYSLPYCAPKKAARKDDSLGEVTVPQRVIADVVRCSSLKWHTLPMSCLTCRGASDVVHGALARVRHARRSSQGIGCVSHSTTFDLEVCQYHCCSGSELLSDDTHVLMLIAPSARLWACSRCAVAVPLRIQTQSRRHQIIQGGSA